MLEDLARLALDDARLAQSAKDARHSIVAAIAPLDQSLLLAARDAAGDVGTPLTAEHESQRPSLHATALANGSRASEALRSLEEALKSIDPVAAQRVERVRYQCYDVARDVALRLRACAPRQWAVCVLITESLCRRPWQDIASAAIDGGADALQLREKTIGAAALLKRALVLRELTAKANVAFVMNDRVDLALASGADGVHLGTDDLPLPHARAIAGSALLLGASTHSLDEAARAIDGGAHYCGVGCMFATSTKSSLSASGPAYFAAYLAAFARVPHLAIGGIDVDRARTLASIGCQGVAVSQCVLAADDPAATVRALRGALAHG